MVAQMFQYYVEVEVQLQRSTSNSFWGWNLFKAKPEISFWPRRIDSIFNSIRLPRKGN